MGASIWLHWWRFIIIESTLRAFDAVVLLQCFAISHDVLKATKFVTVCACSWFLGGIFVKTMLTFGVLQAIDGCQSLTMSYSSLARSINWLRSAFSSVYQWHNRGHLLKVICHQSCSFIRGICRALNIFIMEPTIIVKSIRIQMVIVKRFAPVNHYAFLGTLLRSQVIQLLLRRR